MPPIMDLFQVAEVYRWLNPHLSSSFVIIIIVIVNIIITVVISFATGSREGCVE
jgi:ABC-type multidrug transport system permease subunit